jgi:hypothetical protein
MSLREAMCATKVIGATVNSRHRERGESDRDCHPEALLAVRYLGRSDQMPGMAKGPAITISQFAGDEPPFNTWPAIC